MSREMSESEVFSLPIDYSNSSKTEEDNSCTSNSTTTNTDNNAHQVSEDKKSLEDDSKNEGKKRNPKCARCQNHGQLVKVKGHKRKCPYKDCECDHCVLTIERRELMAKTIRVKRRQKEDIDDGTFTSPEPVMKKRKLENDLSMVQEGIKDLVKRNFILIKKTFDLPPDFYKRLLRQLEKQLRSQLQDKNEIIWHEINIQALGELEDDQNQSPSSPEQLISVDSPNNEVQDHLYYRSSTPSSFMRVRRSSSSQSSPSYPIPTYPSQHSNSIFETLLTSAPPVQNGFQLWSYKSYPQEHPFLSHRLSQPTFSVYNQIPTQPQNFSETNSHYQSTRINSNTNNNNHFTNKKDRILKRCSLDN